MAVLMIMELEGFGTDTYERVNAEMGIQSADDLPAGCIAHAAGPTESGMLIADVWESPEAFGRFAEERLGPTAAKLGLPQLTPRMLPVHNRIHAGSGTSAGAIVLIDTPFAPPDYDAMIVRMPAHVADGSRHPAVSHTAAVEDGRIVVLDVWESPEAFQRFVETQIAGAADDVPAMEPRIVPAHSHLRSDMPATAA